MYLKLSFYTPRWRLGGEQL